MASFDDGYWSIFDWDGAEEFGAFGSNFVCLFGSESYFGQQNLEMRVGFPFLHYDLFGLSALLCLR